MHQGGPIEPCEIIALGELWVYGKEIVTSEEADGPLLAGCDSGALWYVREPKGAFSIEFDHKTAGGAVS